MKWLEAALGACLAGATGVGATSSPSLKPIRLSRHGERRRWGTGATRVSSHRQRGWGIGVRVEGGTTLWDGSIVPTSLPTEDFFFSFKCMCNYTPSCPALSSKERSHNTWYLQVGRYKGPLRWEGSKAWGSAWRKWHSTLATHINQRQTDHLLWRKGLFIWQKLIVLPHHCSSSKTLLQSTKDAELELK